jgi:adenylosuccinate lyase
MKGAVGTAASYEAVMHKTKFNSMNLENNVMKQLGVEASLISTQVSSRKYDYLILTALNSIASTTAKFAGDLRLLQSPSIGEWAEPFGEKQVGSSAMPFKRNPINAEKICSLARYVAALPQVALENATLSYLERTLDDSANKRIVVPEAFLTIDEILDTTNKILSGLIINKVKVAYNLAQYAPFSATEIILMKSVKKGADRQEMHEVLRKISLEAWADIQEGKPNPMQKLLQKNKIIKKYVSPTELIKLLDVRSHTGTASKRAILLVKQIKALR